MTKTYDSDFMDNFTTIDSLEESPVGCELLVWDGCDFRITNVDIDVETGGNYDTNYPNVALPFIAYYVLPSQDDAVDYLGSGED
ncbi:hypothetical protein ACRXCV_00170 (plasmid) [Halobacteriovorax sp. GFR7]|uniref:hypothetical protein n=1 Tax=unclassified Halobacteriovorax TaxID=2639665 RepID=UPI003D9603E9